MEPISLSQGRLRAPLLRMQSDDRLAGLAADGRGAAFEVLVRRHRAALVRACSRILPDSRAEDAVQQGLLNAQQALLRNGPPERLEPWLHRIAVNAALKELQRTPQNLPLEDQSIDGVEQPLDQLERRERLGGTLEAIASLPERQRRALLMRELEGRSHAEIASALGLTAGAARQLIHRARRAMRSAVTALTPYGLLSRLAAGAGSDQAAEVAAGGAASALAGKAVAAVVLAGGIAGGVALAPDEGNRAAEAASERGAQAPNSRAIGGDSSGPGPGDDRVGGAASSGPGNGKHDNSGPGSGDDQAPGHDGPGSGGESVSSGSASSGSGSSGSGSSGSGSSGSGSSGSGSSGSGSSGSGSSGSDSSGSGGGGSGRSGSSGSSGSGSLDITD